MLCFFGVLKQIVEDSSDSKESLEFPKGSGYHSQHMNLFSLNSLRTLEEAVFCLAYLLLGEACAYNYTVLKGGGFRRGM